MHGLVVRMCKSLEGLSLVWMWFWCLSSAVCKWSGVGVEWCQQIDTQLLTLYLVDAVRALMEAVPSLVYIEGFPASAAHWCGLI